MYTTSASASTIETQLATLALELYDHIRKSEHELFRNKVHFLLHNGRRYPLVNPLQIMMNLSDIILEEKFSSALDDCILLTLRAIHLYLELALTTTENSPKKIYDSIVISCKAALEKINTLYKTRKLAITKPEPSPYSTAIIFEIECINECLNQLDTNGSDLITLFEAIAAFKNGAYGDFLAKTKSLLGRFPKFWYLKVRYIRQISHLIIEWSEKLKDEPALISSPAGGAGDTPGKIITNTAVAELHRQVQDFKNFIAEQIHIELSKTAIEHDLHFANAAAMALGEIAKYAAREDVRHAIVEGDGIVLATLVNMGFDLRKRFSGGNAPVRYFAAIACTELTEHHDKKIELAAKAMIAFLEREERKSFVRDTIKIWRRNDWLNLPTFTAINSTNEEVSSAAATSKVLDHLDASTAAIAGSALSISASATILGEASTKVGEIGSRLEIHLGDLASMTKTQATITNTLVTITTQLSDATSRLPATVIHPTSETKLSTETEAQIKAKALKADLQNLLRQQYSQYRTKRLLNEKRTEKDYYVSLTLTQEDATTASTKTTSREDKDILRENKRILDIQGEAGAGKSTWCKQAARSWAEAKLSGNSTDSWALYDWVILLPLHKLQERYQSLKLLGKNLSKEDIWELAFNNMKVDQLSLSIAFQSISSDERELYIFDGLDEVVFDIDFVAQLKRLCNSLDTLIFTSRPRPFPITDCQPLYVTLEGFSNTNIHQFVKDYLGEARFDEFTKVLKRFPDLANLSHNPVQLEMLCYLIYNNTPGRWLNENELTITDLYEQIFTQPELRRYWLYKPDIHGLSGETEDIIRTKIARRMQFLCEVARLSWETKKEEITADDNQTIHEKYKIGLAVTLDELLASLGILRPLSHETTLSKRNYEFPHRSIREYCIARAYAEIFKGRYDEAIAIQLKARLQQDPTSLVFPFLIGLLTRKSNFQENTAKRLCGFIRTSEVFISHRLDTEKKKYNRIQEDILWFKCLTEVPQSILIRWTKAEVLSWNLWDWNSNVRLEASIISARFLKCNKFIGWAMIHAPKIHAREINFSLHDWYSNSTFEAIKAVLTIRPEVISEKTEYGYSALHIVAESGRLEIAQWLVAQEPTLVTEKSIHGYNVLHTAAQSDQLEVVQWLITHWPALVTEQTNKGYTLLCIAASASAISYGSHVAKWLLTHRPELLTEKNNEGQNVLHIAATMGISCAMELLIDYVPKFLLEKDHKGNTPLHLAAANPYTPLIFWLIGRYPKLKLSLLTIKNNFDFTALDAAAANGCFEAVKYIITKYTYIIRASKKNILSAIHRARVGGHIDIVKWLAEYADRLELFGATTDRAFLALINAAKEGILETVELIEERQPMLLHRVDESGCNFLHRAAACGRLNILKWSVNNDWLKTLTEENNDGETPLDWAMVFLKSSSRCEFVEWLAANKPELLAQKNGQGNNLLHTAILSFSGIQTVEALVNCRPQLLIGKNHAGYNPFHIAVAKGDLTSIRFMLDRYPELLAEKTDNADNALHLIILINGSLDLIQFLAKEIPELLFEKNNQGNTTLHLGVAYGRLDIVIWLASQAPELLLATNHWGATALHWAIFFQQAHVKDWLIVQKSELTLLRDNNDRLADDSKYVDFTHYDYNAGDINITLARALAADHYDCKLFPVTSKEQIKNSIQTQLDFRFVDGTSDKRTMLIPYDLGDNHWAVLIIKPHLEIFKFLYITDVDTETIPDDLKIILGEIFHQDIEAEVRCIKLNNDHNSGPLLIHAVLLYHRGQELPEISDFTNFYLQYLRLERMYYLLKNPSSTALAFAANALAFTAADIIPPQLQCSRSHF